MEEIGSGEYNSQEEHLVNFRILYTIVQLIGIAIIILMASWITIFGGGFGISVTWQEFNWHPMLMTIGMVFLYGNSFILAILVYRGYRYARKSKLKISHSTIFAIIMVLTVFGLIAVFDSHNKANPPIPNLYSLHSWIGLSAVILFACQWLGGFYSFFFPQIQAPLRKSFMPYHIYFGLFGYILVIIAALMGISEKAFFKMKNYSDLPHEAVLVNTIGILIILFGGLIGYMVTRPEYKRVPLPEDTILLSGANE